LTFCHALPDSGSTNGQAPDGNQGLGGGTKVDDVPAVRFLRRHFVIVPLSVAIACAALAASAVNHVAEAELLAIPDARPHKRKPRPAQTKPAGKDIDDLLARNMFCSSCEATPGKSDPPTAVASTEGGVPVTSLPLSLLATMHDGDRLMVASIRDVQSGRGGLYSSGEEIPGGTIITIGAQSVDFMNRDTKRLERILLGGAPTAPPVEPRRNLVAAATPKPATGPVDAFQAQLDKSIRKLDDTHFEIDRELVTSILGDPTGVAKSGRVFPAKEGLKVSSIRPGSALDKIGLKNADTIRAVNGIELTDMDKALSALTKLKSATHLPIEVARRDGQTVSMDYVIR
jgi:hypothetical protein